MDLDTREEALAKFLETAYEEWEDGKSLEEVKRIQAGEQA
jgi:hypothetical protein